MRLKKFFEWVHRWFGLVAGFHFVLLGLSGSYLVYEDEIENFVKPSLRISLDFTHSPSLSRSFEAAQSYAQVEKPPSIIRIPQRIDGNLSFNFDISAPDEPRKILSVFVDPTLPKASGSEFYRKTASGKIFIFHHDLFMGRTGRTIMGVSGLLMLALLLTGLILWWPKRTRLASGFKIGNLRNAFQVNFEVHRLTGFYTLILMIVVTFTGVFISRPDWFMKMEPRNAPQRSGEAGPVIDFNAIDSKLQELRFPLRGSTLRIDARTGTISASNGPQQIRLSSLGEEMTSKKERPSSSSRARKINHDLHVGQFWGELGRFLIFISGILPLFFYISGFYIWRKKQTSKRSRSVK